MEGCPDPGTAGSVVARRGESVPALRSTTIPESIPVLAGMLTQTPMERIWHGTTCAYEDIDGD